MPRRAIRSGRSGGTRWRTASARPRARALVEPAVVPADDAVIGEVHAPAYLEVLADGERRGGGWLDADTYLVAGSLSRRAARRGSDDPGSAVAARSGSRRRGIRRCPTTRPPCVRGAGQRILPVQQRGRGRRRPCSSMASARVAIVDWDVHHGDGTQSLFDADPDVCYASTHQSPFYPGHRRRRPIGAVGAGAGTMHNRPLAAGDGDAAFVGAWRDELLPAIEAFRPDAILVSAGYDAHVRDPLAEPCGHRGGLRAPSRAWSASLERPDRPPRAWP